MTVVSALVHLDLEMAMRETTDPFEDKADQVLFVFYSTDELLD